MTELNQSLTPPQTDYLYREGFDPTPHLMELSKKKYLQVPHRIQWINHDAPIARYTSFTLDIDKIEFFNFVGASGKEVRGCMVQVTATMYDAEGRILKRSSDVGSETHTDFGDYIEKACCVPTDARILTASGLKYHHELEVGEMVYAYDRESDVVKLTPLLEVNVFTDREIVRLGNDHAFTAYCNEEHKWETTTQASAFVRRDGTSAQPVKELVETRNLKTHHKLVLAAPRQESCEDFLDVDPDVARLLGFAITDGHWKRPTPTSQLSLTISQAKTHQLKILRELTTKFGDVAESQNREAGQYRPNEQASYDFRFRVEGTQRLLDTFGINEPSDIVNVVPRLRSDAIEALLDGIMLGDGSKRGVIGEDEKYKWVLETMQLCAALTGQMVTPYTTVRFSKSNGRAYIQQRLRKSKHVQASHLEITDAGRTDIWCPTTQYGNWIVQYPNGVICITGNTKAKGRALASIGFGTQFALSDFDSGIKPSPLDGQVGMALADSPLKATATPAPTPAPASAPKPVAATPAPAAPVSTPITQPAPAPAAAPGFDRSATMTWLQQHAATPVIAQLLSAAVQRYLGNLPQDQQRVGNLTDGALSEVYEASKPHAA